MKSRTVSRILYPFTSPWQKTYFCVKLLTVLSPLQLILSKELLRLKPYLIIISFPALSLSVPSVPGSNLSGDFYSTIGSVGVRRVKGLVPPTRGCLIPKRGRLTSQLVPSFFWFSIIGLRVDSLVFMEKVNKDSLHYGDWGRCWLLFPGTLGGDS